MSVEWKTRTVAELQAAGALLVEDGNHGENRPRPDEFSAEGIRFIRAADMDSGRLLFESAQRINEVARQRVRKGIGSGGDVLLSHKGTVGKVAYVPADAPPFVCSPQTTFWRVKDPEQLDRRYIYFFLLSRAFREQLDSRKGETDMADYVSLTTQRTLTVTVPPLAEQNAIAQILGTLDDKIELNRRMNATLEAIARALFQSWFVDFDPVRAKLDRQPPAGLDVETADIFPGTFQDSPIGKVPKGWKVERFDAHITADRGLSYKGEGLRDDRTGLPMHNLNSIYEGGGYKHEGIKYYAGEYREKHLLKPGDMIVTNTEQGFDHLLIGHAAIVPKCYGTKGLYSHHIYRVRHKPSSPFSSHYLVELFNNRRWHYWISGFSNGTTINMLPMDALEKPMLVVPPVELVEKFTALAEAAHLQVEENKQQSRTLAILRDTLLPKLLSGELRAAATIS
jgi:type I restriction enzyme S subunit